MSARSHDDFTRTVDGAAAHAARYSGHWDAPATYQAGDFNSDDARMEAAIAADRAAERAAATARGDYVPTTVETTAAWTLQVALEARGVLGAVTAVAPARFRIDTTPPAVLPALDGWTLISHGGRLWAEKNPTTHH